MVILRNSMEFRKFKEKVKGMPFFSSDVAEIFSTSPLTFRNQLSRWKKQGLLQELKRGLYILGQGERQTTISRQAIAAILYQPSYISLESALSHYQMIPERVDAVMSVSPKKTRVFHNLLGTFNYRNLQTQLNFGFLAQKDENGYPYFIAEPEKALLDYLYLNLGGLDPKDGDILDRFMRLQNRSILNKNKLFSYAQRFGVKKLNAILKELK
jgi:predicted transcriptional regulator of viral defense system